MIDFQDKAYESKDIVNILNPLVKEWFFSKFKEFSLPQLYGVMEIHKGNNILITAPTGGTKTLTSTISIISELVTLAEYNLLEDRVYCVYVNPLKSLSYDLEVNLKNPLKEITEIAKKHNKEINIRIGVRTGDTSVSERSKMLKNPPHILITTPESLAVILATYRFRDLLTNVKYCVLDEIHSLAENKRGVHLSLTLENLQYLCKDEIVRIGLSATVAPLEDVAKFLVGNDRNCKIADVRFDKKYDLKVLCPVNDLIDASYFEMHHNLYELLDRLIQEHKTTLVFTNTRSGTERVIHHLKEKFPKNYTENIGAHHGSLSKTLRHSIEDRMRSGELKVCVSSTSLELGLDIGYIDLVICLGSPKSIARLSQRAGRSGHKLHDTVNARLIVLDRDDLVECAVMLKLAIERKIDRINIPRNCLDILAQQIFGIVLMNRIHINDLYTLIRKSYCYYDLNYDSFMSIIDYLRGRYVSLEDRNIYAKIWYDEETGMLGKRGKLSRVIYITNIGTIPDESMIQVKVNDEVVGVIDEAFLERLKRGDVFVLGGQKYEFKFARGQTAQVNASAIKPPTIPSWFSEMLPLSFDLALEIQKLRYYMEEMFEGKKSKDEILHFIDEYLYVDERGKNSIYEFFKEQYLYAKEIPNYKKIVIEHYKEKNKKYVIFHTLYGRRVNDVLSRVVAYIVSRINHRDVEVGIHDNGFYLSCAVEMQASRALKMIKVEELEDIAKLSIEKAEILRRRFRHCATRALMILRQYKGKTKRVGRQQVSSMILLNAVKRLDNNFPILNEARREVLEDLMDLKNAKIVISDIQNGKIKIKEISDDIPSPFAFNIISQSYTDVLKMEDKIEFLRRMHKKIVDRIKDKN